MNLKIIQNLLTILNQLKYYHWGTDSFARHEALGKAYDGLNPLIDEFVEIYLGKYGKNLSKMSITLRTESDLQIESALNDISNYLSNELIESLNDNDSDLINLKDEILSIINKTKYLLTLN
jgi:hypothetical protein